MDEFPEEPLLPRWRAVNVGLSFWPFFWVRPQKNYRPGYLALMAGPVGFWVSWEEIA